MILYEVSLHNLGRDGTSPKQVETNWAVPKSLLSSHCDHVPPVVVERSFLKRQSVQDNFALSRKILC